MNKSVVAAFLSVSALLAAPAAAAPAAPSKTSPLAPFAAVQTDQGFRIGRADAPMKLVEYASLNCSHCAAFDEQAMPMIERAVAAGRLSYEWRPYLIFPTDPAPTLAARCVAPTRAIPFIRAYYAAHAATADKWKALVADAAWVKKAEAAMASDEPAFSRMVASGIGLGPIAAANGLAASALDKCLGDPATAAWLRAAHDSAVKDGVQGTPTLRLDGKPLAPADLAAALGEPAPAAAAHHGHAH